MARTNDVTVVGGGIIGLTCAYQLACAGIGVTVVDRRTCGSGASWAAPGILSAPSPHRSDAMASLQLISLGMYPTFCAELHERCGIDPEFTPCGSVEVFFEDQQYRMGLSRADATEGQVGDDGQPILTMLSADQIGDVVPGVRSGAMGALLCRRTAQVRTPRLLRALRASCESLGVRIIEQVDPVELMIESGRIAGVQAGVETIRCRQAVLSAGAWSSHLRHLDRPVVEVRPVRGQIVLLRCAERPFVPVVEDRSCYLVPRPDGLVLLGATVEPEAGFRSRVTAAGISSLIQAGLRLVPALAEASVVNMWAGLRPDTPDHRPFIGLVPAVEGLIAATGHHRNGIVLAPVTARAVTDLIIRGATDFDLELCRLDRDVSWPADTKHPPISNESASYGRPGR
ncbi:MAG: glycine oxidase ThiO [Planctomycetes bacterium]|nr:glycine oxidase ThiO [Planctomycetota bacterium]